MIHKHHFVTVEHDLRHVGVPGIRIVCADPACSETRDVFSRSVKRPRHRIQNVAESTTSSVSNVEWEEGQVFVVREGLPDHEE